MKKLSLCFDESSVKIAYICVSFEQNYKEISYMWKLVENIQRWLNKHTVIIIFFKNEKPIISLNQLNISFSVSKWRWNSDFVKWVSHCEYSIYNWICPKFLLSEKRIGHFKAAAFKHMYIIFNSSFIILFYIFKSF